MPKRLVVCCDGTWDMPDEPTGAAGPPGTATAVVSTNVAKLAEAVAERDGDVEQRVFYNRGVGTSRWGHLIGGAFGWGLSRHIQDCYRFLVDWFVPGDALYLFGFSRGAYTARSLAGFIRNCGILRGEEVRRLADAYALYRRNDDASHPDAIESTLFRKSFSHETPIRLIGVWDTVGALGIPFAWAGWLNRRWRFHDVQLSSSVEYAYHVLAIDERRRWFRPTLWEQSDKAKAKNQVMEQKWFAGVHRNVGGGAKSGSGLSDIALQWMIERAQAHGLAFDLSKLSVPCAPDPLAQMEDSKTLFYRLLPDYYRCLGPTCTNADIKPPKPRGNTGNETVHPSAAARYRDPGLRYHPRTLGTFLDAHPEAVIDE